MTTEQPPTNPEPKPSGQRLVVLTHDECGRVVSCTEHYPGVSEPERVTNYEYDEFGRIVRTTQTSFDFPQPSLAS